ncbi:hypothetical protein FIBSPDRAFT_210229 [Athelia psychrophila]|uniref:Uncharacterized protein n=1 Tax=Athelia psychrophila TaxID=1759441 RepID=A0A166WR74_9AGAM|nr:hypothetical protein FIBSPDRAFT_210229 [Fibularhizoctonia sp. CBS 109695]
MSESTERDSRSLTASLRLRRIMACPSILIHVPCPASETGLLLLETWAYCPHGHGTFYAAGLCPTSTAFGPAPILHPSQILNTLSVCCSNRNRSFQRRHPCFSHRFVKERTTRADKDLTNMAKSPKLAWYLLRAEFHISSVILPYRCIKSTTSLCERPEPRNLRDASQRAGWSTVYLHPSAVMSCRRHGKRLRRLP